MKAIPFEIGRAVVSRQGHDKGRRFLVVGLVDERCVLIADGDTRRLERPKKKQTKHLRAEPYLAADLTEAITARRQTADSAIRKALRASAPAVESAQPERITSKEEYALVQN